jgi:glycosyltransferase involved in cell wall biosynthesis
MEPLRVLHVINKEKVTSVPRQWCDAGDSLNDHKLLAVNNVSMVIPEVVRSDILHLHQIKSAVLVLMLAKFYKKKTVYTMHGSFTFLSLSNRLLLFFVFLLADRIVFVNEHLMHELPSVFSKLFKAKSEVVLNGVSYDKLDQMGEAEKNVKYEGKNFIFHPARHVPEKNISNLILAFNSVKEKCDCSLFLAGDGPLTKDLKELCKELNLGERVIFLGFIPRQQVMYYLRICKGFIMPSISEGLNVAFLEALALNKKCIVSRIPSFQKAFAQWNIEPAELDTYFVDPRSIESIGDAICSVCCTEEVSIGSGRQRHFLSLENMLSRYNDIYRAIA